MLFSRFKIKPTRLFGCLALVIAPLASAQSGTGDYSFPTDQLPHASAQTELWNLWLLLETPENTTLALQLRLGRLAINDPASSRTASKWAFRNLYALSAAVTDSSSGRFYPQQSLAREALGLAGTSRSGNQLWINQHSLSVAATDRCNMQLSVTLHDSEHPVSLNLESTGCPVIQAGDAAGLTRGFSQHMQLVDGNWSGAPLAGGHGWLERTWGELADASAFALPGTAESGQLAPVVIDQWRVFLPASQLLVVTRTRRRDGSGSPVLSAIRLAANDAESMGGNATDIDYTTLRLQDSATWQSADSANNYAAGWVFEWDREKIMLTPTAADQELSVGGLHRWSGLASSGSAAGKPHWAFVDLSPLHAPENQ